MKVKGQQLSFLSKKHLGKIHFLIYANIEAPRIFALLWSGGHTI